MIVKSHQLADLLVTERDYWFSICFKISTMIEILLKSENLTINI